MKVTKQQLKKIIHEELTNERFGMPMGKSSGKGHGVLKWIEPRIQELIDTIEKELGASNFLDEILERMTPEEMTRILADIDKEYGLESGGIKRI
jgi:hypothetical protein